jgi:ATPase subunit of ABC transporter with duplicated ATPase domains
MTYNLNCEKVTYNTDSISIKNFDLSIGEKSLFKESDLILSYGQVYGLIGRNGYGKTSLLKQLPIICSDEEKIRILYLEQELALDSRNPVEFIFDSNIKLKRLQEDYDKLSEELDNDESEYNEELMARYQEADECLQSYDPDRELSNIKRILNGLQFTKEMLNQPSEIFSGGWQMRISLARALYLEPDLLLLDEPTNHLDLEAIIWLGDYLKSWKKIAVVISHNIGFLNESCSNILNIENKKIASYKGNYSKFTKNYEKKMKESHDDWEKYEKSLKEMKKRKMTKKELDSWIDKNFKPRPEKEIKIKMDFFETTPTSDNIIKFDDISFAYNDNKILDNQSFGLSMESKVTLVGLNGCGKSTIMKLIMGEIQPTSGEVFVKRGIRIGYFNQHFDQQLPFDISPVNFLIDKLPFDTKDKQQKVREYLGSVGLEGSAHTKLIAQLSGGQKARVAFVKLMFDAPHILLLDEPTNHLDIETVEVLIKCLSAFNGGLLLITHEPELINNLTNEIWFLDKNTKNISNIESFDEYCSLILNKYNL